LADEFVDDDDDAYMNGVKGAAGLVSSVKQKKPVKNKFKAIIAQV
jgi:hypothetical protein